MVQSLTVKKKKHFFQLIQRVPRARIVFCPIDISKDFHIALFHNIDCQPLSEFFTFSASEQGLQELLNRLQATIQATNPTLVFIGMEPTDVYYENLLHNLHAKFYESHNPRVILAIVDPGAVSNNRKQHSLAYEKDDDLDCAAIGELLTRGLYTPARLPEPLILEIKELSRLLKRRQKQLHTLWNQLLVRLERIFPNLLINYKNEKPLCKDPLNSKRLDHLIHLCPDPYQILSMTEEALIELFHQNAWPLGPKGAKKIAQAAGRALLPIKPYQEVHLQLFHRELKLIDSYRQEINEIIGQLQEKVRQTPARHLACIPGSSEHLSALFLAAVEDWNRFPSLRELWATAGFAPSKYRSGKSVHATPHVSTMGCPHFRQAISLMTSSLVWHEPTFGIPCFKRLLEGKPFVPTIIHVGRKVASTALAILKTDQPFKSPFPDAQAANEELKRLQARYKATRIKERKSMK